MKRKYLLIELLTCILEYNMLSFIYKIVKEERKMDNIYAKEDLEHILESVFMKKEVDERRYLELFLCLLLEVLIRKGVCRRSAEIYTKSDIQEVLLSNADQFKVEKEELFLALKFLGNFEMEENLLKKTGTELEKMIFYKGEIIDIAEILCCKYILEGFYPESVTPDWMNRLAVRLAKPEEGSFYDGTAGIGKTADEAQNYSWQCGKQVEVFTQEKNPVLFSVSVLMEALRRDGKRELRCGDTLLEPGFTEDGNVKRFDRSVMFCPLKVSSYKVQELQADPYHRFEFGCKGGTNVEWMFAQHQLASLKNNGTGVMAMFSGSLFGEQYAKIRQKIIEEGLVKCVISLPPNILSYTAAAVSLIVFTKKPQSDILMVDAEKILEKYRNYRYREKLDIPEEVIDEIIDIFENEQEREQVSRRINYEQLEDGILYPPKYIEKVCVNTELFGNVLVDMEGLRNQNREIRLMEELGEFYRGINTSVSAERVEQGSVKILKLADVNDGRLDFERVESYVCKENVKIEKYRVRAGDILFSCKGPSVKTCIVPEHEGILLISQTFIGFRLKPGIGLAEYLRAYFESPVGKCVLRSRQLNSSIVMINPKDLMKMPVVWESLQNQQRIVEKMDRYALEIKEMEKEIRKKQQEKERQYFLDSGLDMLMTFEDMKEVQ